MEYRIEHDSMGEVRVPADKYWGAQTQRSVENFPIGVGLETMPREITHAFGILKKAAAMANHSLKPEKMTAEKLSVISQACDEVIRGQLTEDFFNSNSPLSAPLKWAMKNQVINFLTLPDFVAYRFRDRKAFSNTLVRKFWGVQGVTWTLKTQEEFDTAVKDGWIPIFENFTP